MRFNLPLYFFLIYSQFAVVHSAEIEITPTVYFFNYKEFNTLDKIINKETGILPGVKFSYIPGFHNGFLETHVSYYSGTVEYSGQTQNGEDHKTDTNEELINLGLRLIPGKSNEKSEHQLFFGIQYWHWDRDILSRDNVLGLHEVYTWTELEFGFKIQEKKNSFLGYWLEISALLSISPEMKLELPSSEVTFDLESKAGFRIRGGTRWLYSEDLVGSVSLFAEYWEFGRSNVVSTDDFFGQSVNLVEPRSESFHSGIELGFQYKF